MDSPLYRFIVSKTMNYDTFAKVKYLLKLANTWGYMTNQVHDDLVHKFTHNKTISVMATINGDTRRYSLETLVGLAATREIPLADLTDELHIQWDSVKA